MTDLIELTDAELDEVAGGFGSHPHAHSSLQANSNFSYISQAAAAGNGSYNYGNTALNIAVVTEINLGNINIH
jgi:hypothetical protein